ncbi:hypothetical protein C171_00330 [Pseudomonas phage YMC11/06/C171_PPU_BP]|uniref:Uncharacterized protein n=1 Tax=Pseudomonas phage YMC11/06/C171_PPU_BP TaxID=1777063 RepID=A0A127KNI8_9CAUD|nr:hypothetical protein BH776_gp33 [Pseudomonas phage YMC11/06/C171_PPU_BP]AMO43657.1 hypothetical protein C171_00330 [Pseudomonas phage YMC11/06/C171_PPU_BP]
MGTVTLLPPSGPPPVNEQVVEMFEDLLARAKAGEIDAAAVAFISGRVNILTTFTDNDEDVFSALIGAATVLTTRMAMGD